MGYLLRRKELAGVSRHPHIGYAHQNRKFLDFAMIGSTQDPDCLSMLYALEGAIQCIRWHIFPKR